MGTAEVQDIPIEQIRPFPGGNVREHIGDLDELADSIRQQGIIQPLIVNDISGMHILISGERRLRAARLAGLTSVLCRVRHLSEGDALAVMLIENIQRENLNPIEEARGFQRLLALPGATQGNVAAKIGKSREHVNEMLQLLDLNAQLMSQVAAGQLAVRSALEYLRRTRHYPQEIREQVAQSIAQEVPSVRMAPKVVQRALELSGAVLVDSDDDPAVDIITQTAARALLAVCEAVLEMEAERRRRCQELGKDTVAPTASMYRRVLAMARSAVTRARAKTIS